MTLVNLDSFDNKGAIWNVMIKHCVLFGIGLLNNQFWFVSVLVSIQSMNICLSIGRLFY